MKFQHVCRVIWLFLAAAFPLAAAPVIDPIPAATIPAGKSLIIPITATSTNGRPLTFTITSSTNGIAVVMHTNNPFWKLSVVQAATNTAPGAFATPFRSGTETVTNVGDMTFMLFPEYAPTTINIFQGLTDSGFYNSNTIFHRVIPGFMIQGGDPETNGNGGLVTNYCDEYNPQAIFSGSGQLALANSGKDTDGSQFFVTVAPYRYGDFSYTIFGQLVRGFNVLSNLNNTAVDANDRPLANVIITQAGLVPDTSDTVLTLTATNRNGVIGTIKVIADDGAGGRTTNTFTATTVADTNSNSQPFIYGDTVTNLVAPMNVPLTNTISAVGLDGEELYWWPLYGDATSQNSSTNFSGIYGSSLLKTLTYNETNAYGQLLFVVTPIKNYVGSITMYFFVSSDPTWYYYWYYDNYVYGFDLYSIPPYDQQEYTFVFGDTPIAVQAVSVPPQTFAPFTNLLLATFTNGVVNSSITNFSAGIEWGDDTITDGVITTNAAKLKQVFGAHTYTNSGDYPVIIQIQSQIGALTAVTNTITVKPTLNCSLAGTDSIVAWPSWAFAYQLQSSTNLASANWVNATNGSTLIGFQNAVSNPVPAAAAFFRLKK